MTMGPGGGSDPGNKGRGGNSGRGATGGGGRPGGFDGRDTPGAPDAPDGKRGSTMGRDGGRATGGGNSSGPSNEARRDSAPAASAAAARARDAMTRRAQNTESRNEGMVTGMEGGLMGLDANLGETASTKTGVGKGYSHPAAIAERAKTGMVSPTEMDMAIGYDAGKRSAMAEQSVGSIVGDAAGTMTSIPGVSKAAKTGVGMVAGQTSSTPATNYGAAVARNRAANTMTQSVAQAAATMAGGPAAGYAVGMINTAINDRRTGDIDRMRDALGFAAPDNNIRGSGNGGMISSAQNTPAAPSTAPTNAPQSFEWNPVDMTKYRQGLLSLAKRG